MSYNYGQHRYSLSPTNYINSIMQHFYLHGDNEIDDFTNNWGIFDNNQNFAPFCDKILRRSGSGDAGTFHGGRAYYLKFQVRRTTYANQSFRIGLMNYVDQETEGYIIQKIQHFTVIKGTLDTYQTFEVVFTPSQNFDSILFEYDRTSVDYDPNNDDTKVRTVNDIYIEGTLQPSQEIMGRRMNVKILRVDLIQNLFSQKDANNILGSDIGQITKVGIQGPPGMLLAINGQQIRIGGNGIYQLNNELITITQLGVVPIDDTSRNYFIIDYEYNTSD